MTRANRNRYAKEYRLDVASGIDRSPVPAAPAGAHVRYLLAAGCSLRAIAETAACSPTTIKALAAGTTTTLRRPLAARLLRVRVTDILLRERPTDRVPATGAVRRVQALLALGHSHATITTAMGGTHASEALTRTHQRWVFLTVHEATVRAYAALSMTPGTSDCTRTRAAASGYLAPLWWDDADLDDPTAQPRTTPDEPAHCDHVAIDRAIGGTPTHLTVLERITVVRTLSATGAAIATIATACRTSIRTIERDRDWQGPLPAPTTIAQSSWRTAA